MTKLAVFRISDGSFEQGFAVTLEIGEDGARPTTEVTGFLPPAPEMPLYYSRWQASYRQLGGRTRLSAPPAQVTNVSLTDDCRSAAQILRARLNTWLYSDTYRPVREKWLERLTPEDAIRVIIKTENSQLRRLPWHLLDFLERYPHTEVALSVPAFDRPPHRDHTNTSGRVRLLAVLGNSDGIDTAADRALLEQLPGARVSLLVEPTRQQLTDALWSQPWEILFFAGHSDSQRDDAAGYLYLNQHDRLSMAELKYALQKAVEQGLSLAIFNSCDGLGLARELEDLAIPHIVVMREPIPDRVAQAFLKFFLSRFAQGMPLYQAVREARRQLQGLEDQFPCATWLPVICQNPAEQPPTWQRLQGREVELSPPPLSRLESLPRPRLRIAIIVSLLVAVCVGGVRSRGWLQPLELHALDTLMRLRPDEGPDPRLLIVTIDEEDINVQKRQKQALPDGVSLSDQSLMRLMDILEQYKPRRIGLDLYRRRFKTDPKLEQRLAQTVNLIGICKVSNDDLDSGESPPRGFVSDRLGFSDFVLDEYDRVRRHLLTMTPPTDSRCQASYALNALLAFDYLEQEKGIKLNRNAAGNLQFQSKVFPRLQTTAGGYQNLDARGDQLLLNYRATQQIAATVKLRDLLAGNLKSAVLSSKIRDRIVLVGVTKKLDDRFKTLYGNQLDDQLPGVFVHAHMISQLLSAALDGRPLLQPLPFWGDILWISGASLVGALVVWRLAGSRSVLILFAGGAIGIVLVGSGWIALINGIWLPLVPSALALLLSGLGVGGWGLGAQGEEVLSFEF